MYLPQTPDEVIDRWMEEVKAVALKITDTVEETRKTDPDPERTAAHRVNIILKEWHMKGMNMGY